MKRLILFGTLFILLSSHELFLKTDTYFLKEGETSELFLVNGTFDKSENTITRNRIVNAKIIGPGYSYHPENKDYYDKDSKTYLRFTSGKTGTYTAGISTLPRNIDLSAKDFKEYLGNEGLEDMVKEREAKGISNRSAREKYSKHVKCLFSGWW